MGRADRQVKLRGFRIELGEIESALVTHPRVGEAVALAREDTPGDKRLVAYVTAAHEAPEPAALRTYLKQRLPEYMVPAQCVVLEKLPRLSNGKVDHRALPAPQWEAGSDRVHVAPRTPIEQTLAGIFAALLRVDRVGIDDDFFALGGHSLLATQVVSRVWQALAVELPLRMMFADPTVRSLAAVLETVVRVRKSADDIPAQQGSDEFVV
jgi:acyl carrier protein